MAVKVRVEQSPLKVRVGQSDAIKILSTAPIGSNTVKNVKGGTADVTALNVSGISTFDGTTAFRDNLLLNADNKTLKIQNGSNFNQFIIDSNNGDTTIGGILDVTGASTLRNNFNVSGISTVSTLNITGTTTANVMNVTGTLTAGLIDGGSF